MKTSSSTLVLNLLSVATLCRSAQIFDDDKGRVFYPPKKSSNINWDLQNGKVVHLEHNQQLLNSGNHEINSKAYVNQNVHQFHQPGHQGGAVQYVHKPSGSGLVVQADHAQRAGTNVKAGAQWNLYQKGPVSVDLQGNYDRTYRSSAGTFHPQWQTLLNFRLSNCEQRVNCA